MTIKVKIAQTAYEIEKGLMYVEHMPEDEGMLFKFKRAAVLNFWGRNTYIPLDIAFIDGNRKILHIDSIEPMSLKGISSKEKCSMALEANAGFFKKNGIKVGSKIEIQYKAPSRMSSLLIQEEAESDTAFITFSGCEQIIEGNTPRLAKEVLSGLKRVKISQMLNDLGLGGVPKPDEPTVGIPIGGEQKSQVNDNQLPLVTPEEIGSKLEDSFDPEQVDLMEQKELEDQQEPQEEEQPVEEMPVFENAFQASDWAEHNNKVMRIGYTTMHGRQLTREVEPHGQFHSKSTKRQILVTYDRTVGDIRAFILSNISQWSFTGKDFQKKFLVKG